MPFLPYARLMNHAPALDAAAKPAVVTPRHALLINPFYPKHGHGSLAKHVLTPTLALTTIAAATPPEWTVQIWDENLLQGGPPTEPFPQVVGITVHLTFAQRAYELARWYQERGATVVLGGLHCLSCPEEAAAHGDILALGEGTQLWGQILRDIDRGLAQRVYRESFRHPYCAEPLPRRDLLPRGSYLTTASLIATRGCHNRCDFCYLATGGLSMPYQTRDPAQIVQEFLATGEPYGVFTDNNLGSNRPFLHRLCAALEPIRKTWSAAVTLDITDDPALIRTMALAGCMSVFIGFESLTDENLAEARKKTPRAGDYARRVKILHDHGIAVNGSFVLGFDHDRPDCFARTIDWIERTRLECATFHILTPYPGTPLFRQMEAAGRLLHRDWSRYDTCHAVFRPRHMTPEELEAGYAWCYRRLFSHASIWARRPQHPSSAAAYLALSYLYKKCNWLWPVLIRHRLVHRVWRPVMQLNRWSHLRFRQQLARQTLAGCRAVPPALPAGV